MDDLFINAKANKTPTIDFKAHGELSIEGRSIVEDPINFYKPVFAWIEKLKDNFPKSITLSLKLEFFNTGTGKILLHILNALERINKTGTDVKIIWYYKSGDEEILQAGLDYESIVNLPFRLVELQS
jgi:hypothetical protein